MKIYNRRDLRIAYEQILFLKRCEKEYGKNENTEKYLMQLKKNIRDYYLREMKTNRGRLIKDDGIDGYTELIEIPETEDPEEWFDENARLIYKPSEYDCTGQAFTWRHKIFRRRGKLMCYHSVCFDL